MEICLDQLVAGRSNQSASRVSQPPRVSIILGSGTDIQTYFGCRGTGSIMIGRCPPSHSIYIRERGWDDHGPRVSKDGETDFWLLACGPMDKGMPLSDHPSTASIYSKEPAAHSQVCLVVVCLLSQSRIASQLLDLNLARRSSPSE